MRDPKYKVLVKRRNELETVQFMQFGVLGKLQKLNTGFTTYVISGDRDQFQLLESSGLLDKSGKLIYENHIVERSGKRYLIKYEIGSFMLVRTNDKIDMYTEFTDCWNDDVYPLSQLYWNNGDEDNTISDIEIIDFEHQI